MVGCIVVLFHNKVNFLVYCEGNGSSKSTQIFSEGNGRYEPNLHAIDIPYDQVIEYTFPKMSSIIYFQISLVKMKVF